LMRDLLFLAQNIKEMLSFVLIEIFHHLLSHEGLVNLI